jgi:sulfur-oxidizing protein SoxA
LSRAAKYSLVLASLAGGFLPTTGAADPEDDRKAFVAYYQSRFPDVPFDEFANGIYAIDADARSQWQAIEEFPPYEFSIERGGELWHENLPDGDTLSACFGEDPAAVRPRFPRYDAELGGVMTLTLAINRCRSAHGAGALEFAGQAMIDLTAYLAYEARGQKIDTRIPADAPGALAAYEAGKRFYYTKRGQLNFACADCHVTSVGLHVRADRLGPSLGHPTHFPVYRSKLGRVISLHERFYGCVRDVRARPFGLQSEEFRNLEYFLSYMSNGLVINGPGARK